MGNVTYVNLSTCSGVLDIEASKFASGGCKLSLLQKDLKLAINMSDAVDQPLHVSSAVNEVFGPQHCCCSVETLCFVIIVLFLA